MSNAQSLELGTLAGAIGVCILRWCALIPGLLPILALAALFALPLAALALLTAVLIAVPIGIWRGAGRAIAARGVALSRESRGAQ